MTRNTGFPHTRRDFFGTAAASAGAAAAMLGGFGMSPAMAADGGVVGRSEKPLRAAFSNAGLQATWCAQGKEAAEYWGKLYNVDVSWFDGALSVTAQRSAIENMATQDWDFVAMQALGIGTLTAPVNKMIDKGIPVIGMDTLIAPLDQIDIHSFIAPDNELIGASVTQALINAIGGKGNIVMTQGSLGHTGAQGRARGFHSVVKQFPDVKVLNEDPADWDVAKTARKVMERRGRTDILIGGVDAMPPAVGAVLDGRMYATMRNPSCRIHGGAIIAGVAAATGGEKTGPEGIPKHIVADGPVVTKENAPGILWMEKHFLI